MDGVYLPNVPCFSFALSASNMPNPFRVAQWIAKQRLVLEKAILKRRLSL